MTISSAFDWLLSPLSGASTHHLEEWVVWHARLMVLAWAILLPMGVIAARYYKVTRHQNWPHVVDNRTWWHAHRGLQYSGVVLMLVGVYLTWNQTSSSSTAALLHGYMGWVVFSLGILQILSAWARGSKGGPTEPQLRGDHYDMTAHRLRFEWFHKTIGWLAVVVAVFTIALGLWAADAPRWMSLVLAVWWMALIVCGMRLQRAGRAIDTYQAIWGPDLKHPGNQRKYVGWGMRRMVHTWERL